MEALNAAQAVDLRPGIRLGTYTRLAYDVIRRHIPTLTGGRNVFEDIRQAYELVCSGELSEPIRDVD